MKKVMMALAVVACAFVASAAAVQWKTGMSVKSPNEDGSFSSANCPTASLMIYTWDLGDETTYQNFDASTLWESSTYTLANAKAKNATPASGAAGATASWGTGTKDTDYYAAVLITYDQDGDGTADWYIANKATQHFNSAGTATGNYNNLAKYLEGDNTKTAITGWTAAATPTPEPTSGLLLLLGVAGLALRRKQK